VLEGGFLEGPITDYQTVCANFIRFEIDGKQITGTVAMIDQQRPVCVINLAPPMSRKIRAREKKGRQRTENVAHMESSFWPHLK
jgi:hypothetical protein